MLKEKKTFRSEYDNTEFFDSLGKRRGKLSLYLLPNFHFNAAFIICQEYVASALDVIRNRYIRSTKIVK